MVMIVVTSPFLFVIALLSVGCGSFVVSRINRLEIEFFNKGPRINRAFWYIHDIIGDSRLGKDIRLYNAEKMLFRKGESSFRDLEKLCSLSGLEEKIASLPAGLDTLLYKAFDETGIEPSGGEAQKIAIARAIFKDAPIIVFDEPTAALDPVAEYEIYKQFDRLVEGKTAVYISHRLSSCRFCDRIAVFSDHTIAEYGTHEELVRIKGGIYAGMFEAQAQYYV